jgi:hypothetical protein
VTAAPPPTVEEIVGALLEQRRPELERIVHERVEALVGELVELELSGRTNGAEAATTKQCRRCGEAKGLAAFDPGRLICRQCRNAQALERERRRRGDVDPLAAGGTSTTSADDSAAT